MRTALLPLAIGCFLTWLLAVGLSTSLNLTLPFHAITKISTLELVTEVVTAPATLVALLVIAAGLACWVWRDKLASVTRGFRFLARWAENSFGFEAINSSIVKFTNSSAESLRNLQTGYLNWNIFAVMGGLVLLLVILIWGA
jgi:NADH-quinone oxidoreductase subunit L